LGPDKLPEVMVQVAKFFKSFKSTVADAKQTIEKELDVHELKHSALEYKEKIESLTNEIQNPANIFNKSEASDLFSDITKDFKEVGEQLKAEVDHVAAEQTAHAVEHAVEPVKQGVGNV
jgi:sec-independent protein translocase protein TatB